MKPDITNNQIRLLYHSRIKVIIFNLPTIDKAQHEMVATYFLKRDGEKAALNRFLIYPDTSRRDYSIIPCFNFNLSACFKIQRTANYYNTDTRFLSDCRTDSQIISLIHTRISVTCQLRSKFAMVPCMSV